MKGYVSLAAVSLMWSAVAAAQEAPGSVDSARVQIHSTLRRFYFNLARRDWDALTADVLAAKVVAHRPVPASLLRRLSPVPAGCASGRPALIHQAHITIEGNWAEIAVPQCSGQVAGADEFRLIYFDDRWRFVYIDLFDLPLVAPVER
jgi:hypothetical protein